MDFETVRSTMEAMLIDGEAITYKGLQARTGGGTRSYTEAWKALKGRTVIELSDEARDALLALTREPIHSILPELEMMLHIHAYMSKIIDPDIQRLVGNLQDVQAELDTKQAQLAEASAQLEQARTNLSDVQAELSTLYDEVRTD